MTSRGTARAVLTALALGAVVVAGTSCQGSATGGRADPASPPTSPSDTSGSASEVPVPEPTPTVEPADGPLIDVPGATMRGLTGYRSIGNYGLVQLWGDRQSSVILTPRLTDARSLDAFAREFARERIGRRFAERREDAVVAGSYRAWVIADTSDPTVDTRVYGVMYLDGAWTIDFAFYEKGRPRPLTAEERQQAVDSMLATFAPHRETP